MEKIEFLWTDGSNKDFLMFYRKTEDYYSKIVGGAGNRAGFIPYNLSESISDVLIAYSDGTAVGCAGLKRYSDADVEIKRVWVEPDCRGKKIATQLMEHIEEKARLKGFKRAIEKSDSHWRIKEKAEAFVYVIRTSRNTRSPTL